LGGLCLSKTATNTKNGQQRSQDNRSHFSQKTFTQPLYFREGAFERFKELNPQLGGYKRDLTEGEKYEQNFINQGRRRPAKMRSTEMKRTGYLNSVNRVGVRKFNTQNWDNRDKVNTFWERPKPERKTSSIRTPEEIKARLSNRRFRRGTLERNFGAQESDLQETE
jgi:hypothetical protein